jgi:putative peptidoglycan lipid II flippase
MLFANWFGTTAVAAAYRISQTAFLLPTHALVGDTLSAGLLPLYKRWQRECPDLARALVVAALIQGSLLGLVIAGALLVLARQVAIVIAPGASPDSIAMSVQMIRIMALAVPAYILSTILGYLEAGYGKYGALSSRAALLNVGAVVAGYFVSVSSDTRWLAVGTAASYFLFLGWTIVTFLRIPEIQPAFKCNPSDLRIATLALWKNSASLMALPLIAQANVLIERITSSWIGTAVIPGLDYARFISDTIVAVTALPLGIITIANHGGAQTDAVRQEASVISGMLLLTSFPLGIFAFLTAEEVVTIVFGRGAFDEQSVWLTSQVLKGVGLGLGGTVTSYYLLKALNAQLRNNESVYITVAGCAVNAIIDLTTWKLLGPFSLGLGAGFNGLVMFVLSMSRLKLWSLHAPLMLWTAIGCLTMCTIDFVLPPSKGVLWHFCEFCGATVVIWCVLYAISKRIRRATAPFMYGVRRQLFRKASEA